MRRLLLACLTVGFLVAALGVFPRMSPAQQAETNKHAAESQASTKPVSIFRLVFEVREVAGGKRINSRSYTMLVEDGNWGRIRVGNRVPYNTGANSFQFQDVGINIDCHLRVREDFLLLDSVTVEISSAVKNESASDEALARQPVIRHVRSEASALLSPGKPSLIAALDDVSSDHRYEVEVTATKVK